MLNELFTERWSLLLTAIEEADASAESPRSKLAAVAAFIVDSYQHNPELMKVIIVEVTRAANSFGRTHLPEIRRAYDSITKIVAEGQEKGAFRRDIDPAFASMSFYGAIEQLLSGWIFEVIPRLARTTTRQRSLWSRRSATVSSRDRYGRETGMDNDLVKRSGLERDADREQCAGELAGRPGGGAALAPPLRRGPARVLMPTAPPHDDKSVAELVFDVSERTSTLIREEVELAKAEVTEKSPSSCAAPRSAPPPGSSPSSP